MIPASRPTATAAAEVPVPLANRLMVHLERLTAERRRPRLEVLLLDALCDITGADAASYFKLQLDGGEMQTWLAASWNKGDIRAFDDGVSVPLQMERLTSRSEAFKAVTSERPVIEMTTFGTRVWHPVASSGSAAGFFMLDCRAGAPGFVSAPQRALIDALLGVFRNLMGLLDYSEVDTLTNLLNRKTFDEHLIHVLARIESDDDHPDPAIRLPRRRHALADTTHWLAVLDIDHFKRINDSFGHLIGDEVLLMVANLMRNTFRFRDKLFRFGGEEFVVVLKPTAASQVNAVFERFRTVIAEHRFPQVGQVTISTGYAPIRLGNQPSVIMQQADEALYWSKQNGRNRVASYETLVAEGHIAAYIPPDSDVELF